MTRDELKIRTQQAINAIPILRDKDYGWSEIEKMLNEILLELDDSDWHTGTPTEEGLYWVVLQFHDDDGGVFYDYSVSQWSKLFGWDNSFVVAWQKITLFTGEDK